MSGTVSRLWREIVPLANTQRETPLRVLDAGCGDGEVLRRLARRAAQAGRPIEWFGCDFSETALHRARVAASEEQLTIDFFACDLIRDSLPDTWDVIYCTLFLHHFRAEQLQVLLQQLAAHTRQRLIVDDLLRTRLGYLLCCGGVQLLSRSPIVHVDGPLSVRAGFLPMEFQRLAEAAGLATIRLKRVWPERFLAIWEPPQGTRRDA